MTISLSSTCFLVLPHRVWSCHHSSLSAPVSAVPTLTREQYMYCMHVSMCVCVLYACKLCVYVCCMHGSMHVHSHLNSGLS